ncbi:unnamed protein product [Cuscuta campestris]|uniref:t-SNARE coiled-coil homology domain-containing protein n=1 Tax=Cuscuta campestris TaxID=132261 RepID=A0A484MF79_9ASTE|nr:unnamed protein product [Cuscuta campestris]
MQSTNPRRTLVALHHQGEQISKTHVTAVGIDHDLSRGEKLLGSLGGIFSRKWKPKKTRPISGPVTTRDEPVQRMDNHFERRGKLGLSSAPKRPAGEPTPLSEPTNAQQKVEVEKAKQDDALSDLSNILGELKDMAIDMGSEIERQSQAMHHLEDDVAALDLRIRGANRRGRKLLGK